jgi:structural maintenance of chromosome 2
MYISEIILDGFKSYAQRTVLSGLDPHFNAVTGLNGSGKSNILDAICFVLGISNLSQVRASSLQELVYKQGQSGISKASVTLVFDNRDKSASPPGYETYDTVSVTRQVVLGGRNKYLINGHIAQLSRVQSLFLSMHLNVNNPHFLIMQGRITKVLNMRPQEVLGLLEEAAGTRTYETRKAQAVKVMEKKDAKVGEMDEVLQERVGPMLDRLKTEATEYKEYEGLSAELERKKAILEILTLSEMEAAKRAKEQEVQQKDAEKEALEMRLKQLKAAIDAVSKELDTLAKKSSSTVNAKELAKMGREVVQADSEKANLQKSIEQEHQRCVELEKLISEETRALEDKIREKSSKEETRKRLAEEWESMEERKKNGLSGKEDLYRTRGRIEELVGKIARNSTELDSLRSVTVSDDMRAQYEGMRSELETLVSKRQSLQAQVDKLMGSSSHGNQASAYASELSRFPLIDDPMVVANLIRAKDAKYARAIETALGGRLWNVVTQTVDQAKARIAQSKNVRITCIPMDSIVVPQQTKKKGVVYGSDCVVLATNSAASDDSLMQNVIDYLLGRTAVCETLDEARKVAFEHNIRTVTLDGDVVDPQGTMSGGSQPNGAKGDVPLLMKIATVADAKGLKARQAELKSLVSQIDALERAVKSHPFVVNQGRLQDASSKIKQLEDEKRSLEDELKEKRDLEKLLDQQVNGKDAGASGMDKALKAKKQSLTQCTTQVNVLTGEITALQRSVSENQDALQTLVVHAIPDMKSRLETVEKELSAKRTEYLAMKAVEDAEKETLQRVRSAEDEKSRMSDTLQELNIQIKRVESDAKQLRKEVAELSSRLVHLSKAAKQQTQAVASGEYSAKDIEVLKSEVAKLDAQLESISRRGVNKKSLAMLSSTESEYGSLLGKRDIIMNDKDKISRVISELDDKKTQLLMETFRKVNVDFGSIFASLLPNAFAKLEAVNAKELSEGIEIKVRLGAVWKDSLVELSGGQRSLVALALILALLKYKPAPVYILDEVDAALDLSHTQSIGRMIAQHFSGAQFLVVSLKEGMWGNAKVVYRTTNANGVSSVTRLTGGPDKENH